MVTSTQALSVYGQPGLKTEGKYMVLWDVPTELQISTIPKRIYCNRILVDMLKTAFKNIIERKLADQIKTWDGCYQVRKKRGQKTMSLHSWGLAIDINAAWNGFGAKPTMSSQLVKCFTDAGFDWGGIWTKPDGMHFQISKLV